MDSLNACPDNIWQYKQNTPSLVAKDLSRFGIARHIVFKILMARGVFKWLACRRDLIRVKNAWKDRIRQAHREIVEAKANKDYRKALILKGRIKALEECRKEVRDICHSERWRAPDNDREARRWVETNTPEMLEI